MTIEARREQQPAPGSIFSGDLRATTIGILIVVTMIAFEAMAVTTALPTAARDLHGLGAFGWAFTGFLVANVVGMVVAGGLSDARGARLPLTAGLLIFPVGLIVAGTATTMEQLVAGRVVQGLGGGLLVTAAYVIIGSAYPEALRPKVFAALSSAWVIPAAVGPTVAGALTEHLSWRWVFLGLLPFVVLGAVLMLPALRTLQVHRVDAGTRRSDARRIGYAFAVALGIAALENAGQHLSAVGFTLAVPGLVLLVWGLRALLPPGTFTVRPGVAAPIALRGVCAGAFFGMEATIPLSLAVQHHYTPTLAGLPLTAAGFSWTVGSWWQGRDNAADLRYRILLVRLGFAMIATAAVLIALADQPSLPGWLVYIAWLLAGAGAGLSMSSVSVLMLNHTTDALRGAHSAALQLSDATASAITTGVAGVLVAAAARGTLGYTGAFTTLAVAMGAIAAIGSLVAGRLRAPDS